MMAVVAPAYEITQDWGSGFEAGIELQNLDTETVNDWVVSFDYAADITSIWDAAIVARDGDRYTIEHADWNATLAAGQAVAFGFIGAGDSAAPTNFLLNGEPLEGLPTEPTPVEPAPVDPTPTDPTPVEPVPSDPVVPEASLSASLSVVSDWGSGFTGEVTVRNDSTAALEGWNVSFDFAGEISSVWNGEILSRNGSTYVVGGVNWNAGIAAGSAVSFGFSATPGGTAAVLENVVVSGVNNGPAPVEPAPEPAPLPAPTPEPSPEPTPVPVPTDGEGRVFVVNPAEADIVSFNSAVDQLDFGEISVHNLIVGKTEAGEVAIINPWAWTPEYQVLVGIGFDDLTLENYGIVGNEHLRQDLGGVISWELGVGPREAGTVYVRSHEYGVQERVENFDPAVNKLSFLYFGTRERLSVEDTADGVLISVEPTGQSVLLAGVAKADLVPANIEFHHDQIVEDQLEVPFGFTVEQVAMVSRVDLLTPLAPEGAITDGNQTSPGSVNPHDGHDHDHGTGDMTMPMDPVVVEPAAPEPTPTDPVPTDPVVTDPDPVVTDPVVIDPVVEDPAATDPTPSDPVMIDPAPVDPTPTDPVAPADPSALPIASHDKVLAAYFPEWGIYGRDYHLADVPADQLTHLIYAFADLTVDGEMTLFDSYAATEKRFSAEESVTGEADLWYYPPEDPRSEQTVWGNFNQLALLKDQYPHLTVSIAVGGWTLSDHFSTVTSTQAGRDTFSDSIVEFLTTYQVFDGIDFDWEYPGGGGEAGNSASPDDGANYALLLADVRAKLDDLGSELGRTYEISVASPAGLDKIANFNLAGLAPSVDFFNVMTYDFHGTWEDTTGHQAAFTGDPNGYDIETAVYAYLDAGVAPEQIVLGAPLYTRAWSGVADGGDGGYDEAASGAAPGTFEAGNYDYKDLLSQINAGAGWELYWDDNAQASYLYNADLDIFSSFETTTSVALKAEWVEAMGLGGMMFWDLSNDATGSPDSLISAAFRSMVLEDDIAEIQADSSLPDPIIIGGDGEIGPLPLGG